MIDVILHFFVTTGSIVFLSMFINKRVAIALVLLVGLGKEFTDTYISLIDISFNFLGAMIAYELLRGVR